MVRTMRAFLDFCYIARRDVHNIHSLRALRHALSQFHHYRTIFETTGVRPRGFALPRQHAMVHYFQLIVKFAAPNGLCSSITESRHITAVKKPWRRSSRWKALGQMLLTNQRLDKLAAARVDFGSRGMLDRTCLAAARLQLEQQLEDLAGQESHFVDDIDDGNATQPQRNQDDTEDDNDNDNDNDNDDDDDDDDDESVIDDGVLASVTLSKTIRGPFFICYQLAYVDMRIIERKCGVDALAGAVNQPNLCELIRRFLYDQLNPDGPLTSDDVPLVFLPWFDSQISVHTSAVAIFHAPSDPSSISGMRRERIQAVSSWRKGPPRYDTVFVNADATAEGMRGLYVGRVHLLFAFQFRGTHYPCALIRWFRFTGDGPDEDTGMWIIEPELETNRKPRTAVIHLDCILRAAHLSGVYGNQFVPEGLEPSDTLDVFKRFYVNKYIDHNSVQIAF
jgi:hypothetical protein